MKTESALIELHILLEVPNGISRLRDLILQLAVDGKLVRQDSEDESASALLMRAREEKESLIERKIITRSRSIAATEATTTTHGLPPGWAAEYLGNIAHVVTKGSTPTTYGFEYQTDGIRFVKVESIEDGRIQSSMTQFITEEANQALARSQLQPDDLLFSIAGTIGKTCIVRDADVPANTNQALAIIRETKTALWPPFLRIQLNSFLSNTVKDRARGGAMNNVSLGDLKKLIVLIPPYQEQKRISVKVDELMALCDELEKLRAKQEHKRLAANSSALNHLVTATESDDFRDAWRFISRNFSELYSVGDTITDLRKAILQLAVMGKLIPQDPNDPPARDLLEEIEAEKLQLIKEKKIKASKPLPKIKPEEVPYELPEGWEWVMLGDLNPEYQNGISKRNSNHGTETIVLRLADIIDNEVSLEGTRGIRLTDEEREKYLLNNGDILVTRVNGSADLVGSFIRVRNSQFPLAYCDHFIRMRLPLDLIDVDYLHVVSKSALIRRQIEKKHVTTAGQRTVNQTHITTLALPIPPLPEQHRIVAKINKLMILCGTLEEKIDTENGKQSAMLDAVLAAVYRELDIKSH